MSALLRQGGHGFTSRKSSDAHSGKVLLLPSFELPGIHISRIETMDFDEESLQSGSICGGGGSGGGGGNEGGATGRKKKKSKKYIIVHNSDAGSDFSRLSFPSEYSLSGSRSSRSSRSRSSRDSSNVSSRLWDFSPRESDWDVTGSISRQDFNGGGGGGSGGGGLTGGGRDYSLLSPTIPRKGSVVTFDIGEPAVRRHSSPAPSVRRRDSECACTAGKTEFPSALKSTMKDSTSFNVHNGTHNSSGEPGDMNMSSRATERRASNTSRRKSSCEQSLVSITIDEERTSPHHHQHEQQQQQNSRRRLSSVDHQSDSNGGGSGGVGSGGGSGKGSGGHVSNKTKSTSSAVRTSRSRASMRRINTEDSDGERRGQSSHPLLHCKLSLTDSMDDVVPTKGGMLLPSLEAAMLQTAEAETQTSSEPETPRAHVRNICSASNVLSSSGFGWSGQTGYDPTTGGLLSTGMSNRKPLETINVASLSDNEDINSSGVDEDNEDVETGRRRGSDYMSKLSASFAAEKKTKQQSSVVSSSSRFISRDRLHTHSTSTSSAVSESVGSGDSRVLGGCLGTYICVTDTSQEE